jgi:hypothetical protein
MLRRISAALVVLCLAALLASFLTDGRMDACCAAATIPCVRLTNQAIAMGKEPREEEANELACLAERLAHKEAEWRVLIERPGLHAWRLQMTGNEMVFLKGAISSRHARLQDTN